MRMFLSVIFACVFMPGAVASTRNVYCEGRTLVSGTVFERAQLERLAGRLVPVEVVQLASIAAVLSGDEDEFQNSRRFWDIGMRTLSRRMNFTDEERSFFGVYVYGDAVTGVQRRSAGLEIAGKTGGAVMGSIVGNMMGDTPGALIVGGLGARVGGNKASEWAGRQIGRRIDDVWMSEIIDAVIEAPCLMTTEEARAELERLAR